MSSLSPEEVRKRYGKMFCQGFYTLVDEKISKVQIVERCIAKGPVEWDAVNRLKAQGAIKKISIDGTSIIMESLICEREVRFGPSSKRHGAQALKSVRIEGEEVRTTWLGLAGASIGLGACLAQAPGVIRADYHTDAELGGSRQVEITIVTPKLVRLVVGIDDTDTKERGATWALALRTAQRIKEGEFLLHRIIQLNPDVKEKTTNCTSTGISFGVRENDLEMVKKKVEYFVKRQTYSEHTVVAFWKGLLVPNGLKRYGLNAKKRFIKKEVAERVAKENDVEFLEITGSRGMIGALAAVGCFDMGLEAAGLIGDGAIRKRI